ncbi:sigma-70 family RNA polymerase sigma factor [Novosphingobium sp. BL-8A]|uniref:RNA polymerase sigma factor n=1 Tax=Novosphingobium sp. BL-8A TaxID=3127639 RepID=UPI0037567B6F
MRWIAAHVIPHEAGLRRWLVSRRLPGIEIDDIVQETYVRLIRVEDVGTIRDPRSYLRRAAYSVIVSHIRSERVVPLQMMADLNDLGLAADEPGPEQQAVDREELLHLGEAIAALPGKIGDVFRLRRVSGLPQREVAKTLGLAESTVEKHLKKALTLLLDRFARGGNMSCDASMQYEGRTESHDDANERRSGR